jgi:hypothetical protein
VQTIRANLLDELEYLSTSSQEFSKQRNASRQELRTQAVQSVIKIWRGERCKESRPGKAPRAPGTEADGPGTIQHPIEGERCMDDRLTVRLHKILRAPWAVPPSDCYRVIEFGFLAITREGCYLQVNGSVVQRLNRADVDAAIYSAEHLYAARPAQAFAPAHPAEPVTVIRKKRRTPTDAGVAP